MKTNNIYEHIQRHFKAVRYALSPKLESMRMNQKSNTYRVALFGPLIVNSLSRACAA